MVETIVTVHRVGVIPGALVGTVCGVVLARLGVWGLVFTGPALALAVLVTAFELRSRELSTGELAFAAACGMAIWVVR